MNNKRKDLSDSLLSLLFGACIFQIVTTAKSVSIENNDAFLIISAFLTAFRFYIGNKAFISDPVFSKTPLIIWIYDLTVIIIQSALFIALGTQCTLESNIITNYNFYQIYISILILDIVWIFSQSLLGKLLTSWKRKEIPIKWAFANSIYLLIIFIAFVYSGEPFDFGPLLTVLIISVIAFIFDVIKFDYAGIGKN